MKRRLTQQDAEKVGDLAFRGASNVMIATLVNTSEQSLVRHFGDLLREKRAQRKLEILDCQMAMLRAGNSTMGVWLGRNEVDQSEERKVTVEIPPNSIILEVVECRRRADTDADSTDSG